MGTFFRGTEAAPTFWFAWNAKVEAASVPRMRGKNHLGSTPSRFQVFVLGCVLR